MGSDDDKDTAEVRRERLQALRERRGARKPASEIPAAAPRGGAGGQRRGAGRRAGAGGDASSGEGGRGGRGAIMKMLRDNPERREELMERFPKLRERLQNRDTPEASPASDDSSRVAELEKSVAELKAAMAKVQEQLKSLDAGARTPAKTAKPRRSKRAT